MRARVRAGRVPCGRAADARPACDHAAGIAADNLRGRIFEVSLADLQNNEDDAYRKIRLIAEEVQGRSILTNFHGMTFTTDKLRSLVKKWQTLIEAVVNVKTADHYLLRVFVIAFTKRRQNQISKTTYAQSSQVRAIRAKMVEIINKHVSAVELKGLVALLLPEAIGKDIEKECYHIFPLQNVFVRKVKIIKKPKFDIGKLLELHGDTGSTAAAGAGEDTGAVVDRMEPPVQESV